MSIREASPVPSASASAPTPAPEEDWTIWRRADVSLKHVHAVALYLKPRGEAVREGWAAKQAAILSSCAAFHAAQFPGSRMTWSLHGPLDLPLTGPAMGEGDDAASNCAYNACCTLAQEVCSRTGALPPPVACDASWSPAGGSSAPLSLPTVLVSPIFLDWGCEAVGADGAGAAAFAKYYVHGAAALTAAAAPGAPTPAAYLSSLGITRAGGSRARFLGTQPVSGFSGVWSALGLCGDTPQRVVLMHGPAAHVRAGCVEVAAEEVTPPTLTALAPVSFGVGVVTQEAWVAPHILGSDIVAWHEGLGHSLNLPHPSARDNACVMSHAQYAQIPLLSACVCEELKAGMRHGGSGNGLRTAGSSVARSDAGWAVKLSGSESRLCVLGEGSRTATAAHALALIAALDGDVTKVVGGASAPVHMGWLFEGGGWEEDGPFSPPAGSQLTLFRRRGAPLAAGASCMACGAATCASSSSSSNNTTGGGLRPLPPAPPSESITTASPVVAPAKVPATAWLPLHLLFDASREAALPPLDAALSTHAADALRDASRAREAAKAASGRAEPEHESGEAWVETVITFEGSVGDGGGGTECQWLHATARDVYFFKESGMGVGSAPAVASALSSLVGCVCATCLSPSAERENHNARELYHRVWAGEQPALAAPSLAIESLSAAQRFSRGGGSGNAASSLPLCVLLWDEARDFAISLPLLDAADRSYISVSGLRGAEGYHHFVRGAFLCAPARGRLEAQ